jgi:DHA2 family multidrug resistance protein-like MFS transporter
MLLLLLLGPKLLPEFRSETRARIDWPSAALSALGILPFIYGIKHAALAGLDLVSLGSVLSGVAIAVVFVRRQRALAEPLIDLELFRTPALVISLIANLLTVFVTFGSFLFVAQYLQEVLGLSPLSAGLWTMPSTAGFIVGSSLAPQLAKRFQTARIVASCLLLVALGLLVLAVVEPESSLTLVVTGTVLLALGSAPAVTLGTDLIVSKAPADRAGAASAFSETSSEFGGALGIAILGTIGGAIYRMRMSSSELSHFPVAARDTLNGALAESARLPADSAALLLDRARHAFVAGMHAASLFAALVALASALLVFARLRTPQPASHEAPDAKLFVT